MVVLKFFKRKLIISYVYLFEITLLLNAATDERFKIASSSSKENLLLAMYS